MAASSPSGNASLSLCPLTTGSPFLLSDQELRAYKLGKGRGAYNKCSVSFHQEGTVADQYAPEQLTVATAVPDCNGACATSSETELVYRLSLSNGLEVSASFFLVYADPVSSEDSMDTNQASYTTSSRSSNLQWRMVSRSECTKGCTGPLLKPVRRYGRMGRISSKPVQAAEQDDCRHKGRYDGYMYVAIDEASKHVQTKHFRLLVGVFDVETKELLGTSCSQVIRVLANNDCPAGAAFIQLIVPIKESWIGWTGVASAQLATPDALCLLPAQEHSQTCHHDCLAPNDAAIPAAAVATAAAAAAAAADNCDVQSSAGQSSMPPVAEGSVASGGASCLQDDPSTWALAEEGACLNLEDVPPVLCHQDHASFREQDNDALLADRSERDLPQLHLCDENFTSSSAHMGVEQTGQTDQSQVSPELCGATCGLSSKHIHVANPFTSTGSFSTQAHSFMSPSRRAFGRQLVSRPAQPARCILEQSSFTSPPGDGCGPFPDCLPSASGSQRAVGAVSPTIMCSLHDRYAGECKAGWDTELTCSCPQQGTLRSQGHFTPTGAGHGTSAALERAQTAPLEDTHKVLSPRDPRGPGKPLQDLTQQRESTTTIRSLKRKLEWHVDQLAWERRKVAALERALQLSDQHLLQLHERVRNFSGRQETGSNMSVQMCTITRETLALT